MTRLLVADLNASRASAREPYRLLAKQGFQVLVLVPSKWKEAYGESSFEPEPPLAGLEVKALRPLFNGRYHRVRFQSLEKAVAQFQPDHLWIHAEPENFLAAQALAARDRACPRAELSLVSWRNLEYRRGGLPYKGAWLHQKIEDHLKAGGARLLCYNEDAARIMGGLGFKVIPTRMGVSLRNFSPGSKSAARRALGLHGAGKVAGFAGRCIAEKGVEDLVAALEDLRGWSLLLIGDGPKLDDWLRLAKAKGVQAEHRRLGSEQMALGLRAMDALVLPSHSSKAWKEQFGRVLVEAMACGTPVIGSDSGAIPQVIGKAGIVFPEGDRRALASALQSIPSKAAGLRKLGLKRAKEYSWPAILPSLKAAFGPSSNALNRVAVQGVGVFTGSRWEALGVFDVMLRSKQSACVFYLNAHTANLAASDPDFRAAFRQADLVLPDGAGVLISARLNRRRLQERLALGDLLAPMAERAGALGQKVFLWGGEPGVAQLASVRLKAKVVGQSHGFQKSREERQQVIGRIKKSGANVVFLGMGSPIQEAMALRLKDEIPGVKAVVCGNAFAFLVGLQQRAPHWMQNSGMEWFWRFMLEPGRLSRRYLVGNTRFLTRAVWERLGGRP